MGRATPIGHHSGWPDSTDQEAEVGAVNSPGGGGREER